MRRKRQRGRETSFTGDILLTSKSIWETSFREFGSFPDRLCELGTPTESEPHTLQVALQDGTILPVPIKVQEDWTFYLKRSWALIVALTGVGAFGAFSKLLGFFKKSPGQRDTTELKQRNAKVPAR